MSLKTWESEGVPGQAIFEGYMYLPNGQGRIQIFLKPWFLTTCISSWFEIFDFEILFHFTFSVKD